VKEALQFDYTAVGHVTVDVLSDDSRHPGGSAFYSALQAARLGQRTLILTRGVPREIEELLEPYGGELELRVLRAPRTTTLETSGWGASRSQRVLAWAGPIEHRGRLETGILHLAPVAGELGGRWRAPGAYVGLTPQGMIRRWPRAGGVVSPAPPSPWSVELAGHCDALVLSREERPICTPMIERTLQGGGLVLVTAESHPTRVLLGDGSSLEVEVPPIREPLEDLGAGDVFAAACFVELAQGADPGGAAALATAAAAVRMQGVGAGAIGDLAAIRARLGEAAGRGSRVGSPRSG
jgi:sugar/nucleoside kinase (ribokinase family)